MSEKMIHVVLTSNRGIMVVLGDWDARETVENIPVVKDVLATFTEHDRTEAESHAYIAINAIEAYKRMVKADD